MPAVVWTWTGAGATNFVSEDANWDEDGPGTPTDLVFNGAGGAASQKNDEFDEVGVTYARVQLTSDYLGTLHIAQDTTFDTLAVSGGTLTVDTGKTLSTTTANLGAVTVNGRGTLALTGITPTLGVFGTFIDLAAVNVPAGGTMNITGNADFNNVEVTQQGTLNWTNGMVQLLGVGSRIANTGTMNVSATDALQDPGKIDNPGLIRKTGAGLTRISSQTNNIGPGQHVTVDGGVLRLGLTAGAEAGTSEVKDVGVLEWLNRNVSATATVFGAGTLRIGQADGLADGHVNPTSSLTVLASNVEIVTKGKLTGTGVAIILGATDWEGGTIGSLGATSAIAGPLTISGMDEKVLDNWTLDRYGGTTWTGGNIKLLGNAAIKNYGAFEVRTDSEMFTVPGATPSFQNLVSGGARGVVSKPAGAATTTFKVDVTNAGDFNFQGRTMRFEKAFTTQAGGKIDLASGTMNMAGQTLSFTAGQLVGAGTIVGDVSHTGGTFKVGGTLNVQGTYTQGASATLDVVFSNGWGKLAATGAATLAGTMVVTVEAGAPDDVWTDVVTSPLGVTNNMPGLPNGGYDLRLMGGNLQIRKP